MRLLKEIIARFRRYRKIERLRKQMHLTRQCCRQMDLMLEMQGVDFANTEPRLITVNQNAEMDADS